MFLGKMVFPNFGKIDFLFMEDMCSWIASAGEISFYVTQTTEFVFYNFKL